MINGAWRLLPSADLLYACDAPWWSEIDPKTGAPYAPGPADFAGLKLTQSAEAAKARPDVDYVPCDFLDGLSRDPLRIRGGDKNQGGGNSGTQAISLAHNAGAGAIILVGFDMQAAEDGATHYDGNYPPPLWNPRASTFANWRRSLGVLAQDAAALGLPILNASKVSALECFPRVTLGEALASWA